MKDRAINIETIKSYLEKLTFQVDEKRGKVIILPVWLNIDMTGIAKHSALLAGLIGVIAKGKPVADIVNELSPDLKKP